MLSGSPRVFGSRLRQLLRRAGALRSPRPWSGVYRAFSEVPATGAGYDSSALAAETLAHTRDRAAALQGRPVALPFVVGEHALLPMLVAVLGEHRDTVRVLDFGGGMGVDFVYVMAGSPMGAKVEYHVVENQTNCSYGRELFAAQPNIHFHEDFPELPVCDVVFSCSALQYVEDYRSVLRRLCSYRPSHILFTKLGAGTFPTFATTQTNLPGTRLPYWFFNVSELGAILADEGYTLRYRSLVEREYDQSNLPEEYRLPWGRACNLLFSRPADRRPS